MEIVGIGYRENEFHFLVNCYKAALNKFHVFCQRARTFFSVKKKHKHFVYLSISRHLEQLYSQFFQNPMIVLTKGPYLP